MRISPATLLLASVCASLVTAGARAESQRSVFVTIPPQAYVVERIGGEHVDVNVLVGPGQSPHTYQATPKQMIALGEASLYFTIGVEVEDSLLPRIRGLYPKLTFVDTLQGVKLRKYPHRCDHDHGHEHEHAHQEVVDPHVWMSPRVVKQQAQTICDELVRLDPAHEPDFRRNVEKLIADLEAVQRRIANELKPLKGKQVFVFHPAFGYFLDEFGLEQVPVESGGKQPTAKQLISLIERAKKANVKVIFVQPQFSTRSAEAVAEAIGGAVVPIDPLARDYLANLEEIAKALKKGLTKE